MKLVSAIIRASELDTARRALGAFHAPGLTVTGLLAASDWNRHLEVYRATVLVADLVPRLRVDILTRDEDAADLALVLARIGGGHRRAGDRGGDDTAQVWISRVECVVRVRTGERGEAAL
ncbi:MAG TPA: P-II family nitrogen regulator [Actinocrinis sp.]|nr:P-II family nitrogen regulator [Actinocrinis sp.]